MSKLFLVGTGPGAIDWLTPHARNAIGETTDIVGYGLYLDMLAPLVADKKHHTLPLGAEVERARVALNLAANGNTTALLSSGDIGIYAMATLVFELLNEPEEPGFNSAWLDVEIEVIPGISAMQAASSRVGAMLGHDFCTISLSDLLTPWQTIEQRIHAAGQGDFVVSFYNPVSKKRDWQLNHARDILLTYRPASTPVVIGRQLTRDDEHVRIITLGELDATDVDMFTLVSVGNRETRCVTTPQQQWAYTPRGYAAKLEGAQ